MDNRREGGSFFLEESLNFRSLTTFVFQIFLKKNI